MPWIIFVRIYIYFSSSANCAPIFDVKMQSWAEAGMVISRIKLNNHELNLIMMLISFLKHCKEFIAKNIILVKVRIWTLSGTAVFTNLHQNYYRNRIRFIFIYLCYSYIGPISLIITYRGRFQTELKN